MGQNGERQVAMRSQPPIARKNVRGPAPLQTAPVPVELESVLSWVPYPPKLRVGLLYFLLTRAAFASHSWDTAVSPSGLIIRRLCRRRPRHPHPEASQGRVREAAVAAWRSYNHA